MKYILTDFLKIKIEISYQMRNINVSFAIKRLIHLIFPILNAYMKHIPDLTCSCDALILLLKIYVLN